MPLAVPLAMPLAVPLAMPHRDALTVPLPHSRAPLVPQAAKLAVDEHPCVNDVHMAADNKFGCARRPHAAAVYFLHRVLPTPCTSYTVYFLHRRPHAAAASPPHAACSEHHPLLCLPLHLVARPPGRPAAAPLVRVP